jgi:hypothetical protein
LVIIKYTVRALLCYNPICAKDRETPDLVTKYWQPPINNILHSQHQQSEARFLEEWVATGS